VLKRGGAIDAVESGYIKQKLVESNAARLRAIENGDQVVVGVNKYIEGAPSPLTENLDDAILSVDPEVDKNQRDALGRWKLERDNAAAEKALAELRRVANAGENMMTASIAAAHAGVTTGEWANTLREVWGEYRAPTGVAGATVKTSGSGPASTATRTARSKSPSRRAMSGSTSCTRGFAFRRSKSWPPHSRKAFISSA